MEGDIPVLKVEGQTLPEAWEKAVIETWNNGIDIKTEYDKEADPPSRDCTMIMVVHNPMAEPRIHRAFPGGLEDLEIYTQEVVDGVHDHWINPEEGKWTYTYHKRLFGYEVEGQVVCDLYNSAGDEWCARRQRIPQSRRCRGANRARDATAYNIDAGHGDSLIGTYYSHCIGVSRRHVHLVLEGTKLPE